MNFGIGVIFLYVTDKPILLFRINEKILTSFKAKIHTVKTRIITKEVTIICNICPLLSKLSTNEYEGKQSWSDSGCSLHFLLHYLHLLESVTFNT